LFADPVESTISKEMGPHINLVVLAASKLSILYYQAASKLSGLLVSSNQSLISIIPLAFGIISVASPENKMG
jgi:hypothetical protein